MEFVPKRSNKELISLRIDKELLEKIDMLAQEYDLSRNEFMVQCVDYAISNIKG